METHEIYDIYFAAYVYWHDSQSFEGVTSRMENGRKKNLFVFTIKPESWDHWGKEFKDLQNPVRQYLSRFKELKTYIPRD